VGTFVTGEPEQLHLRVSGEVQGVGFRWFVTKRARALGLAGWVRNLESGEVLVFASGRAEDLALLRSAIGQGPPGARVESLQELHDEPGHPASIPFSIIK
jgi:acylphosphatase